MIENKLSKKTQKKNAKKHSYKEKAYCNESIFPTVHKLTQHSYSRTGWIL